MKKLFLFAVSFLLLLPLAKAENIIQLTGGNYIFAEEGKLVFNIDPEVFLNRNWRYDASKKDGFKKDENGEYKKPAGEYFYRVNYYLDCIGHCTARETKDFSTEAEAIAFAQEATENFYKRKNANEKPEKEWQCISKYVLRDKASHAT